MIVITLYEAPDGVRFKTTQECLKYEELIDRIELIMAQLPALADSSDFRNGDGYIQHSRARLSEVLDGLVEIIKEYHADSIFDEFEKNPFRYRYSLIGRVISETGPECLNTAWYRIGCISDNLREYGQQYYANHENEAKDICLNPGDSKG